MLDCKTKYSNNLLSSANSLYDVYINLVSKWTIEGATLMTIKSVDCFNHVRSCLYFVSLFYLLKQENGMFT